MRKEEVLQQLVRDMERFLAAHQGLNFYALALDCNTEYGNFLLCMNTPEDFERTLRHYQRRYEKYADEKWIKDLRYNPGDWDYTDISEVDLFEEEELVRRYGDDLDNQCREMMDLCEEILRDFRQTKVFGRIPKAPDFISFCIDHDEDVEEALERQIHFTTEGENANE